MALSYKDDVRDLLLDSVFTRGALSKPLPKYKFPMTESLPADVFQVVQDELFLDGNARQNLATFCQTWEEPEVHKIMDLAIDKNMIDKDEYPQTAELESRCVHMLADLWNSPHAANTLGTSAVGSSEACMLGGLAMKWRWRARMKAAGKPTDKPNIVCGPVQICWHKFARYWDVELREVPMERGRLFMTPEDMLERIDENTIGVAATLGVTHTGNFEPVQPLSEALDRLQAETGPRHRHPCRWGVGRVPRAVLRAGPRVGLPPAAGQVDLDLGPQVRPRAARRGLGDLARHGGPAGGSHLQGELPRRRHADLGHQLLPAGRADRRAVLQFPASRPRGLSQGPHGQLPDGAVSRRRDRQARSVRAHRLRRSERRAFPP